MTHPLTDKIIDKFGTDDQQFAFELATKWEPTRIYLDDDMRDAADWQLAQCLNYIRLTYGEEAMVPFMEAMRPTTQENN